MSKYTGMEIAIIGCSGRFPGANNIDEFWENLKNGVESINTFEEEEILTEGEDEGLLHQDRYVRRGAYVSEKEYFDAEFFGFLPAEARVMDPQIRIFLQECWRTLEDAGYASFKPTDKIGLFAGGASNVNWSSHAILSQEADVDEYTASQLRDVSFLCSRIAYLLNLQGPAVYMNTACSTSLVAVQRAVMSLLLRECKMALAGGVTINNHAKKGYLYEEGMIRSDDGHCRPFDAEANGTVSGEGAGVVMLKRLKDALEDNDHIYAIIKGGAVNNDGHDKVSFTAPSIEGQSETILKSLGMAKVPANSISYVETHGTATSLGDPIEVEALNVAYGKSDQAYCGLGSVKSNIGHTDAAAGVAGLIKTIMALKYKQLPPSLHFKQPNPKINFQNSPFYVNAALKSWERNGTPLRAGVSSFGIGGTNAHLILEEAPKAEPSVSQDQQLLLVSGNTPGALERNKLQLADFLERNPEVSLADVAYTLQVGRETFKYRTAIAASDLSEAIRALRDETQGVSTSVATDKKARVIWMFSGQGAQYQGMVHDLYQQDDHFKKALDECLDQIAQHLGREVRSILFDKQEESLINETQYTQPLLFAVEYSMAKRLQLWGIQPDALIGHSIGEYVAACIAEVMSLQCAIKLVVKRGQLMQSAPRGSMLSVNLQADDLTPYLAKHSDLAIAAINTEEATVISGPDTSVDQLMSELNESGVRNARLHTSHAFHSSMMKGAVMAFERELQAVTFNAPKIPIVNNIEGQISDAMTQPDYWANQIVKPVKFAKGVQTLLSEQPAVFIELGPGKTLSTFVNLNAHKQAHHKAINLIRHPKELVDDQTYLYQGLGKFWAAGLKPDWKALHQNEARNRVSLPTYSFEKKAYPVLVNAFRLIQEMTASGSDAKKPAVKDWFYRPTWKLSPLMTSDELLEGPVLIFRDEFSVGNKIAESFEKQGASVIQVALASQFEQRNERLFTSSSKAEDLKQLFDALKQARTKPALMVYAWSLSKSADDNLLDRCYLGIHTLTTAMTQTFGVLEVQLVALTNHAFDVFPTEQEISSEKGMTSGLLKVIAQEHPAVVPSMIELGDHIELDAGKTRQLVQEITHHQKGKVVALQQGLRFVQIYESLPMPVTTSLLKQQGVYLITGGLGSLGFVIAEHLLRQYEARVLLVGRQEAANLDQEKVDRLSQLETLAGSVRYLACDVTNQQALQHAISEAECDWGSLKGVFHAAGIVSGHTHALMDLDQDQIRTQLAPKVAGLRALHAALDDRNLDFCLLTSSLASVLGGVGFGAYASANGFMDHFVQQSRERNWMSLNLDGLSLDQHDALIINKAELIEVLELSLQRHKANQLIISTHSLEQRLQKWVSFERAQAEENEILAATDGSLEERMLSVWKQFFGREEMTVHDDFFEVGGDSLKALTMVNRLHQLLGVSISIGSFFNHPTVSKLSAQVGEAADTEESQATYVSIPKAPKQEVYSLSSAQKRLYFLWEFDPQSLAYNMPMVMRLKGHLDTARFADTFQEILHRHDCLRTVFEVHNDEQVQRVQASVDYAVENFSGVTREAAPVIQGFIRPFDLTTGPMIRVGLMKLLDTDQEHLLLVDMHHIITDGVSMNVLVQEFMQVYERQILDLPALHYTDFAHWQQSEEQQTRIEGQKAFWLQEFAEVPEALDLPYDRRRPALKSHEGGTVHFKLDQQQTNALKQIAEASGATMYMVVLSIYHIFLSKLTNQKDIVIGTPVAGRPHADLETVMGVFANALPIRNHLLSGQTFQEFLASVKRNLLACFQNQEYPYEELIDELKLVRDTSRNPLFDVEFSYENFEQSRFEISDLTISQHPFEYEVAQFDLALTALERDDELLMDFEYAKDLFDETTIVQFVEYFQRIVAAVTTNDNFNLSSLELINKEDHATWFQGKDLYIKPTKAGGTVLDLFKQQVALVPQKEALVLGEEMLTYQQLDEKSNALARKLVEANVRQNSLVAILLDRSPEVIISVLAVLKAGAAYLPMDILWPTERIETILEESSTIALIALPEVIGEAPKGVTLIDPRLNGNSISDPMDEFAPDMKDDAYVIYTSGSTGKPKGVVLGHETLANYVVNQSKAMGIASGENILQFTTLSFDPAAEQIWLALLNGATLVLVDRMLLSNNDQFNAYLEEHAVTHLHATPSYLSTISLKSVNHLKRIVAGGEACPWHLVQKLEGDYDFYNKYGPTEATISVVQHKVTNREGEGTTVPIGRPMAGVTCYVLDDDMNLLPPGARGQLYIGGNVLAKGYLNDDLLTEERFIRNPFTEGKLMYKTGDVVCWLPDGNLEFLGRKDKQVKVRGHRIEMGEIEQRLLNFEGVTAATVTLLNQAEEPTMAAYYAANGVIEVEDLRAYLRDKLPDYMVPPHLVELEAIPLTSNGKVDHKALPEPMASDQEEVVAPANDTEVMLREIWATILKRPEVEIGVTNGFFELGGHSLNAILLIAKIQKKFNTKIQLTSFFKAPTIRAVGQSILLASINQEQAASAKKVTI